MDSGLQEVETYISCRQNTVAQYISTGPIMNLCLAAEQHPGTRLSKWWWGKEVFYFEEESTSALKVERGET